MEAAVQRTQKSLSYTQMVGSSDHSQKYAEKLDSLYESEKIIQQCSSTTIVKRVLQPSILPSTDFPQSIVVKKFINFSYALNEVQHTSTLEHENLIHLNNCYQCPSTKRYALVYPFLEGNYNSDSNEPDYSMEDIACYAFQLVKVLQYLSVQKLVHRNVKRENITFDQNTKKLVLIDLESMCDEGVCYEYGNPRYRSPEMNAGDNFDCSTDMWSAGVCIAELVFKIRRLFSGYDTCEEISDFAYRQCPTQGDKVLDQFGSIESPALKELLLKMLTPSRRQRIRPSEAMKSPFFVEYFPTFDKYGIGIPAELRPPNKEKERVGTFTKDSAESSHMMEISHTKPGGSCAFTLHLLV